MTRFYEAIKFILMAFSLKRKEIMYLERKSIFKLGNERCATRKSFFFCGLSEYIIIEIS